MLQEVMHSHSISVVEEAVLEPIQQAALTPAGRRPRTNTISNVKRTVLCTSCTHNLLSVYLAALGYSVPTVPNGVTRIPSVGDTPSHPSTRHPSVASTRLPSVGEESTHPLLVAEDPVSKTGSSVVQNV